VAKVEWWRVSWQRVAFGLLAVFSALLAIMVGLLTLTPIVSHVETWHDARKFCRDEPVVAILPQPLKDTALADLNNGMTITHFDYSVQVPWTKTKIVRDFKTLVTMSFDNGTSLVMSGPAGNPDPLGTATRNEAAQRQLLRHFWGDEAISSHYDFVKAEMSAQPRDVSIFHSRSANARANTLMLFKRFTVPEGSTVIYSVGSGQLRGFQFGNPKKAPTSVELLLFDQHDHSLKLSFRGPNGSTQPVLSQEQINAIVASIQPPA